MDDRTLDIALVEIRVKNDALLETWMRYKFGDRLQELENGTSTGFGDNQEGGIVGAEVQGPGSPIV